MPNSKVSISFFVLSYAKVIARLHFYHLKFLPEILFNGDSFFFHIFCFITYYFCGKRRIKTKQHFAGTQTVRIF